MVRSRVRLALLAALVFFVGCKLGFESSRTKTRVVDTAGNLLAHAAVTTLSFRDQQIPAWERNARLNCGDVPRPVPSRLDDLVYELIPESSRQQTGAINRGDSSLCRHQSADTAAISNLFANKALAIKVKYLPGYENYPPPTIRFNSGGEVRLTPERFASLFIGRCHRFAVANGVQFCQTTDHVDGKVIWVALIAPPTGSFVPHGADKGGGKGAVVAVVEQQQAGKVAMPVEKGPVQGVEQIGYGEGDPVQGVGQVDYGKGGQPFMPRGGRIDMHIILPWQQNGFQLAVNVPNFNAELINYMRGGGGGHHIPPVDPTVHDHDHDRGEKLERSKLAVIAPRPSRDPDGKKNRELKLTLETSAKKPSAGRWAGFIKLGVVAIGGVAASLVAASTGGVGVGLVMVGGATIVGGSAASDLYKWLKKHVSHKRVHVELMPGEHHCPAVYATNLTFEEKDTYLTFKSERKHGLVGQWSFWDNLDKIPYTYINQIRADTWDSLDLKGFTVYYCRMDYEKDCYNYLPDFEEKVKKGISACRSKMDQGDPRVSVYGKFQGDAVDTQDPSSDL